LVIVFIERQPAQQIKFAAPIAVWLEFYSKLELKYARQISLCRCLAEVCVSNIRINASETNIIKKIERIRSKNEL
jgi:uncharacterized tellurite resistance protein B-like protein